MKDLKEYIVEGIFDIDDNIDNIDESIKDQIKRFLRDEFKGDFSYKISDRPNADGKYEVSSSKDIIVRSTKITSLTNDMFIWTTVGGDFICNKCDLTSLKGAPKEVGGDFICNSCNLLTSLEGAPKEVGGNFYCWECKSLKSLKGAPEKVGGDFICNSCNLLTSLEGAPREVGGRFECGSCYSLTSLEGAPKEVGGGFYCRNCRMAFTIDDIKKVSNVNGRIKV